MKLFFSIFWNFTEQNHVALHFLFIRVGRARRNRLFGDAIVVEISVLYQNYFVYYRINSIGFDFAAAILHRASERLSKCAVSSTCRVICLTNVIRLSLPCSGPAFGCRWLFRALGVSYEIRGIENIRRDHGGVILMNHQSSIDLAGDNRSFSGFECLLRIYSLLVLAHLWPIIGRATVVSKKALLYAFPFGPASWLWGTIFIDRSNRSNAIDKMNQESVAITKHAAKLLLFPEGTRSQGEKLLPFKKGAFHIAVQSQSIVQPVVISKYHFLDSKNKQFGSGESKWKSFFARMLISVLQNWSYRTQHHPHFAGNWMQRTDERWRTIFDEQMLWNYAKRIWKIERWNEVQGVVIRRTCSCCF